jgi:type I restriction-modification system DNA methylase subunit
MAKPRNSEVHAYGFIREDLRRLGWDTRNPSRYAGGQVYTQNECLSHPEIQGALGLERPENIVKITDTIFWPIEAKADRADLSKAISEAEGYALKINRSKNIKAAFVSGVAGNQIDNYLVQTKFFDGTEFHPVTVNGKDLSALLSPSLVHAVLRDGPEILDLPIDEELFLKTAEKINQILHLGAINKNVRARVMAALLLSVVEDANLNVDAKPRVLIEDINTRARALLESQGKEQFSPFVALTLPASRDNHIKFKNALVQTLHELKNLNIRSAMNSSADVLGKFYEVFLKYGNGAKEIGIVLTPRHITKFAVDVVGVTDRDVVYDPACGTAGFLVAAFDQVRQDFGQAQVERFRKRNLFGVDQDPDVVALAIVNMIFRGDGKNNIVEGDCFQKHLVRGAGGRARYSKVPPGENDLVVTRVLMNPPFALKTSDEKEYRFVDSALREMQDGGLLFSVLPYSAMVKPDAYQRWRENLLAKSTLLAVITFPEDVFYPIGVHALGIFVRKGVPHPPKQNVLWIRGVNDGLLKSKGKRLPNPRAKNDYGAIRDIVKAFLANPTMNVESLERFQKACPIDFDDPLLELVPENYLDQAPPSPSEIRKGVEEVIRNSVAFLIRFGKENEHVPQ